MADQVPVGFTLIEQADATAVCCLVCGRRWNAARVADPRNQQYLEEHAEQHRKVLREQPDPKAKAAQKTAVKRARGERAMRELLEQSTGRDHANGA